MHKTSVDLFAGCGGASLGLHRAGYTSLLAVEKDPEPFATLSRVVSSAVCADVQDMGLYTGLDHVDLLWASPPCQAFSKNGDRVGAHDERNGWPWTFDVIDQVQPTWVIAENVAGMQWHRPSCTASPEFPSLFDLAPKTDTDGCPGCYWESYVIPEFNQRYPHVSFRCVNTAEYGVPQRRERVFLVAGPNPYSWPEPTHSLEALFRDKWDTSCYWSRHGFSSPLDYQSPQERKHVREQTSRAPWVTVRDVFSQMAPEPQLYDNLWLKPPQVTRTLAFRGHTEAILNPDMPAPTVTTRNAGARTNAALIWRHEGAVNGRLRYLTTSEAAALQSFPSDHPWQGGVTTLFRQIGNAVPPLMAEHLARALP